ncbi:MAG: ABC transporter substrate-binding protein [bacterium]|nr:ABC transporter substrate-binding protein [bacterium]
MAQGSAGIMRPDRLLHPARFFVFLWLFVSASAGAPFLTAEAAPVERYVLGAALELSGAGAAFGKEARDAILLEVDRINRLGAGQSPRREIWLIILDTAGLPAKAASAVRNLALDHNAVAIIGPTEPTSALWAAAEAERQRVPFISLSSAGDLFEEPKKWVFSSAQSFSMQAQRILQHMQGLGMRKAAVLAPEDEYGAHGRERLSALAPEAGISLVLNEAHSPQEHNFLPFIQQAMARSADVFLGWTRNESRLALLRARLALDADLPVYLSAPFLRPQNEKENSRVMAGVRFPAHRILATDLLPPEEPGLGEVQWFRAAFSYRFQRPPGGMAAYAADAVRIFAEATSSKKIDRSTVQRKIEEMRSFMGLTGRFRFSRRRHQGLSADSYLMIRVGEDGKWELDRSPKVPPPSP